MTKRQKVWEVLYPFVTILLAMAAVSVVLLLVIGLITGLYDPNDIYVEVKATPLLISICFYLLTLWMLRKNFQIDNMRFGMDANQLHAGKSVLSVVLIAGIGTLVSFAISYSGLNAVFTGYASDSAAAFQGQNLILLVLATVLIGPVAEEVTFRGMIFRRARHFIGWKSAAVLSALMFGIYHGNFLQFLYGTIIGILLAWQYEKSRSLKLCIVTHMCLNVIAIFLQ